MCANYLRVFIFLFFGVLNNVYSQKESWFYIRATSDSFAPKFDRFNDLLTYRGDNENLKKIFADYTISEFKKTYKNAKKSNLKRTFFVVVNDEQLLEDLLINASENFDFGEIPLMVCSKFSENENPSLAQLAIKTLVVSLILEVDLLTIHS